MRCRRPCKEPGVAHSIIQRRCAEAEQGDEEASPQVPPPPTHPSGVVVDVVGTNRGNHGCSCEEDPDGCSTAVLANDVVVRIQKDQILVENYLLGKGRMRDRHFAL